MSAPDQLATLLAREIDCLQRLLATLKQEYEALTSADIELLEKLTTAKNVAMGEQAELATQRSRLVAAAGHDPSNAGLESFIATCSESAVLTEALESLSNLARECQHYNRENGRIIVQKQHQTQNALNILRQSDGTGPTYSMHGTTAASDDSRTLGKA